MSSCKAKWCRNVPGYARPLCAAHYAKTPADIRKRMRSYGVRYGEMSSAYQQALRDALDFIEREEKKPLAAAVAIETYERRRPYRDD